MAAGLERAQEARRLVFVVGLLRDRQRALEPLARDEREREVDQRDVVEARLQQLAARVRIEVGRADRDADVVGLQVEVDEVQLVDRVERDQAVAGERPPVRAILEDVAQQVVPSRSSGSSVAQWSTVTPAS